MNFLKFLEKGLQHANSNNKELGDRSKYVGASDVGQCLKKSYLEKTIGREFSLEELVVFQRGHNAENIVELGLNNHPAKDKYKYYKQVETNGNKEFSFMKSHIDFVVEWPKELVVLECKSISSPLPNNKPRESWLFQVALQIEQLRHTAKKPINRAIIVVVDVNTGQMQEFNIPYSKTHIDIANKRAKTLWSAMENNIEPKGEISDLCGFCAFKSECDALQRNAKELPDEVVALAKRAKELSKGAKEAKAIRGNLLAFMQSINAYRATGGDLSLSIQNRKGQERVNLESLRTKYPQVAKEVTIEGDPFSVLKIL